MVAELLTNNSMTDSPPPPKYRPDNILNPTIPHPSPLHVTRQDVLEVRGPQIIRNGVPILLRGACLGGWSECCGSISAGTCIAEGSSGYGKLYDRVSGPRA